MNGSQVDLAMKPRSANTLAPRVTRWQHVASWVFLLSMLEFLPRRRSPAGAADSCLEPKTRAVPRGLAMST